ncbi:MAG TPA: hypothetical protein VFJ43_10845, partial [Bacteroidia bacterium]|nr:hypothetical protein [Bacteroidia bacterium]
MKKLFIFAFILTSIGISAQNRQSLLSAALKNSNANDSAFYMRDSVLAHFYYDAESDSMILADLKSQKLITAADVAYMTAQLTGYKPHCWSADSIPHSQIIPSSKTPGAALN